MMPGDVTWHYMGHFSEGFRHAYHEGTQSRQEKGERGANVWFVDQQVLQLLFEQYYSYSMSFNIGWLVRSLTEGIQTWWSWRLLLK